MDHAKVAGEVVEAVGGASNISAAAHCATRLRLVIADESKINQQALDDNEDLKGTFAAGGMFQIIVGPGDVDQVYAHMVADHGVREVSKDEAKEEAEAGGNIFSRFIKMIADIFVPILPALVAGGLMLAINNVMTAEGLFDKQALTQMYPGIADYAALINMVSSAAFASLPVLVGFSAAKRFGGNVYLGAAIGAAMVSSDLLNAWNTGAALAGEQTVSYWHIFGMDVAKIGYQAQVIPALLAGLALGFIETRLKRIVPDYLYLVVVPVCSLILAVFLAHAFIGPFGRMIGDGVAFAVRHLMTGSFAPIGAALFGFLYAPLVITGVHQTTLAIDMQMIQSLGGTPVWPIIALSNIAQASAVTGIIIVSRKHNEREISVPAAISAYLGVTEPAMYGINLKYRFPMLCAMIGSGLAGLLCGLNGVMANGIGVGGLPGILSIQPSFWQVFALAMAVAIIIPMALTTVVYQRKFRQGTLQIV